MPEADRSRVTLLHEAVERFGAAWAVGDVAALDALLSPSYTHGDIYGGFQDRAAWLAYAAGRAGRATGIGFREVATRIVGEVAIVTGINDVAGIGETEPQDVALRFTQVWIWRDARWLREAFQATVTTG